ncbi:MAG: histidine phosphatase family protein [Deltaproteobacteria bacterium]|nr:histidine phosphatase family protein [Deltaproteobacteria bacterium]MDQ3295009.1 histidine phosphatase family protein [Myxococcota bacterium]
MHILLVRHGETSWNRDGRYQGRTDIPLSSDGEAQVRRLGVRLAHVAITAAISSPLSRARKTAEAILVGRDVTLELDSGLQEISHGAWEGQLSTDVEAAHAEMLGTWRSRPDRDVPAGPGAETLGQVEARAWPVIERVTRNLKDSDCLLVAAHDAVNRVLLCRVLGLPLTRVWAFRQSPATLNVLSGPALSELVLVRLNDSEHVSPLLQESLHRAL